MTTRYWVVGLLLVLVLLLVFAVLRHLRGDHTTIAEGEISGVVTAFSHQVGWEGLVALEGDRVFPFSVEKETKGSLAEQIRQALISRTRVVLKYRQVRVGGADYRTDCFVHELLIPDK